MRTRRVLRVADRLVMQGVQVDDSVQRLPMVSRRSRFDSAGQAIEPSAARLPARIVTGPEGVGFIRRKAHKQ
jgi:hypothetical protein